VSLGVREWGSTVEHVPNMYKVLAFPSQPFGAWLENFKLGIISSTWTNILVCFNIFFHVPGDGT
jgi:hypothetical protein